MRYKPIEGPVTGKGRSLYHSDGQPLFNALVLACVEASNVINDPKCSKGPKCNSFSSSYA